MTCLLWTSLYSDMSIENLYDKEKDNADLKQFRSRKKTQINKSPRKFKMYSERIQQSLFLIFFPSSYIILTIARYLIECMGGISHLK